MHRSVCPHVLILVYILLKRVQYFADHSPSEFPLCPRRGRPSASSLQPRLEHTVPHGNCGLHPWLRWLRRPLYSNSLKVYKATIREDHYAISPAFRNGVLSMIPWMRFLRDEYHQVSFGATTRPLAPWTASGTPQHRAALEQLTSPAALAKA